MALGGTWWHLVALGGTWWYLVALGGTWWSWWVIVGNDDGGDGVVRILVDGRWYVVAVTVVVAIAVALKTAQQLDRKR